MGADTLRSVREAARKAASAREHLEVTIRLANSSGASLRQIAEAAGISYETVRRIISQGG